MLRGQVHCQPHWCWQHLNQCVATVANVQATLAEWNRVTEMDVEFRFRPDKLIFYLFQNSYSFLFRSIPKPLSLDLSPYCSPSSGVSHFKIRPERIKLPSTLGHFSKFVRPISLPRPSDPRFKIDSRGIKRPPSPSPRIKHSRF